MKWLSVKKYVPGCNCNLFVYCEIYSWSKVFCASYETDGNYYGDFYTIKHNDKGDVIEKIKITSDVTHFCIPDPIEIED